MPSTPRRWPRRPESTANSGRCTTFCSRTRRRSRMNSWLGTRNHWASIRPGPLPRWWRIGLHRARRLSDAPAGRPRRNALARISGEVEAWPGGAADGDAPMERVDGGESVAVVRVLSRGQRVRRVHCGLRDPARCAGVQHRLSLCRNDRVPRLHLGPVPDVDLVPAVMGHDVEVDVRRSDFRARYERGFYVAVALIHRLGVVICGLVCAMFTSTAAQQTRRETGALSVSERADLLLDKNVLRHPSFGFVGPLPGPRFASGKEKQEAERETLERHVLFAWAFRVT